VSELTEVISDKICGYHLPGNLTIFICSYAMHKREWNKRTVTTDADFANSSLIVNAVKPLSSLVADWRDFEEITSRHDGKQQVLDDLMDSWSSVIAGSIISSTTSLKSAYCSNVYASCYTYLDYFECKENILINIDNNDIFHIIRSNWFTVININQNRK